MDENRICLPMVWGHDLKNEAGTTMSLRAVANQLRSVNTNLTKLREGNTAFMRFAGRMADPENPEYSGLAAGTARVDNPVEVLERAFHNRQVLLAYRNGGNVVIVMEGDYAPRTRSEYRGMAQAMEGETLDRMGIAFGFNPDPTVPTEWQHDPLTIYRNEDTEPVRWFRQWAERKYGKDEDPQSGTNQGPGAAQDRQPVSNLA